LRKAEKVMNIKIYIIIAASAFGLIIVGRIISGILGPKGYTPDLQVEK